jgi:hypothetical protein
MTVHQAPIKKIMKWLRIAGLRPWTIQARRPPQGTRSKSAGPFLFEALDVVRRCERIAAVPPAVRKGSALPHVTLILNFLGSATCQKAISFPHSKRRSRGGR